jgi:hypothetical protein
MNCRKSAVQEHLYCMVDKALYHRHLPYQKVNTPQGINEVAGSSHRVEASAPGCCDR